jgi:hypothetical protein
VLQQAYPHPTLYIDKIFDKLQIAARCGTGLSVATGGQGIQ